MYLTGALHVALALVALVSGLVMLLMRKGTPRHRKIGWVYAVSMLGLNATALLIYRLFGRFGPFHVAALISLLTIIAGLIPPMLRRPRRKWPEHHAYWMNWSYVGLCAAAASEVTTRLPASPFWWTVIGSTLVVIAVGGHMINSRVPIALQRFRGRPPFRTGRQHPPRRLAAVFRSVTTMPTCFSSAHRSAGAKPHQARDRLMETPTTVRTSA